MCKLVVLSDMQINYQDRQTVAAVHKFLADFRPDTLVLNGDIVDMTALSRFRLTLKQRSELERQRYELRWELASLRETLPDANIVYILGNHEQRLVNYIEDNAPELEFLADDELSFYRFADLDFHHAGLWRAMPIKLVAPYGEAYEWHGVTITHGTKVVDNTAKASLITEGSSGVSGHTHRMGSYFKTDRSGAHAWFEGGCLCSLRAPHSPPPTLPGVRDWQQGFVVGYGAHGEEPEHTSQMWNLYPVHITDHKFIWGGQLYDGHTD